MAAVAVKVTLERMAVQISQQRGQTDNFSSEDRERLSTECTILKMGTEGRSDGPQDSSSSGHLLYLDLLLVAF